MPGAECMKLPAITSQILDVLYMTCDNQKLESAAVEYLTRVRQGEEQEEEEEAHPGLVLVIPGLVKLSRDALVN